MKLEESKVARRKLIGWLGVLSLATIIGGAFKTWNNKQPKTVKMLTQEGKLVEVDVAMLSSGRKKISDNELKNWVKSK